ncbi:MAG: exodeoxyribonuclease V subunit gamma [Verrucomicrobia bacterium]|nr:exodeoxyribonuclease V subunit gamma [Verrucomicrobiota bacterium]
MAQWLRLEVASRLGVCLNVAFPFPRKFLLDCLERFRPGEVRSAAFDPATVTWRIAEVLPTLVARPGFEPVASYLGRDPDPRKLHQLAARLAESFDQYAVYRPDWIECWEEGGCPARDPWQAELWRVVWADRAPVHPGRLMRWLVKEGSQQTRPEGLPERVFGVITTLMPPVHLEMFAALSAHMEVQLFVLAGSRGWYAVAEGGTLGAERAWSVGRDHGSAGWKPAPQAQGVTAGAERAWSVGTESGSAGWKPAPQGTGESGEGHPLWQAGGRDGRELAGLIGRLGGRREWIGGRGTGCGSMLGVMQRELGEDRVAAEDEDGSGGTVGASGSGGGGVESGMCRLEARTTGGWDESAEGGDVRCRCTPATARCGRWRCCTIMCCTG